MNFAVKITSPFPYLSLKSTAGAFRYFSVHDNKKFHDLLSFCYHSQRWNFEAEQRQLRLDQHSRLRFLPQSGFGNLWRIWLLSKPVGKTAKTSFFYFKKSKYGSNSPHMSLIKIADSCASSSTNRITPSPECRASQSYETIAVFLFARLPPRALLAASPLARDSCSATFPRGFSSKRETARSLPQNHLQNKAKAYGCFSVQSCRFLVFILQVLIFKYSAFTVIFVLFLLYIIASIIFCFCVR